jgi:Meckel syndrome type 1 protein
MDSAAPAQATAAASLPRATLPAAAMPPAEPATAPAMEPAKQPPPKMMAAPLRTPTADALRKAVAGQSAERISSKAKVTGGLSRYTPAPMAAPAAPPGALQETSGNSVEAAPEMPATMAAAPAPTALPADQPTASQVAVDSAAHSAPRPTLDEAAPVAPRMRAKMPVALTPFTPAANMDTTSYASDTPAQELDKIRQLFALGHNDEAQQRLTAYHLAHPRWDLPLDLQARLRKP